MTNPQELKKALLAVLAEKGDYQTLASILDRDEKREDSNKLTKLIEPMSAVADILTGNAEGAFMDRVEKKTDDFFNEKEKELRDTVKKANDDLKALIEQFNNESNTTLTEEIATKVSDAKLELETSLARYADAIVERKANAMFATLGEQAKLTEDEVEQIIMDAALQVESQLASIIGNYVQETGITTSQITDFEERVKAMLPNFDLTKLRINASQIIGLPDFSGAASRVWVEQRLANFSGSSSFLDLTDTPSSYTGDGGKLLAVKGDESGLEFVAPTGTGTVTSVAISGSDGIEVDSGSPITAAGTIALGVNAANLRTHINVENGADVTDATNVAAAGAIMDGDFGSNGIMERTGAGTYGVVTKPSGVLVGTSGAQTIINKRVRPRTSSSTSNANLTPNLSSANVYYRTTQTVALSINAPIGTPVIGETILIYVDSASDQTLNINATFIPFGAAFPATTTAGKTFLMSAQYNGTNWKTLWANQV